MITIWIPGQPARARLRGTARQRPWHVEVRLPLDGMAGLTACGATSGVGRRITAPSLEAAQQMAEAAGAHLCGYCRRVHR